MPLASLLSLSTSNSYWAQILTNHCLECPQASDAQLIMIRESDQSAGVFTLAELRGTIGAGQEHRRLRDSICDFSGL